MYLDLFVSGCLFDESVCSNIEICANGKSLLFQLNFTRPSLFSRIDCLGKHFSGSKFSVQDFLHCGPACLTVSVFIKKWRCPLQPFIYFVILQKSNMFPVQNKAIGISRKRQLSYTEYRKIAVSETYRAHPNRKN